MKHVQRISKLSSKFRAHHFEPLLPKTKSIRSIPDIEFSGDLNPVNVAKFPEMRSVSVAARISIIGGSLCPFVTGNLDANSAGTSSAGISPVIMQYAPESKRPSIELDVGSINLRA